MANIGCDSCLRSVLRKVDAIRQSRFEYPFSYWEHGSDERSLSTDAVSFRWVYEPHGNNITVGKVIKWLGPHDFLVLDTSEK